MVEIPAGLPPSAPQPSPLRPGGPVVVPKPEALPGEGEGEGGEGGGGTTTVPAPPVQPPDEEPDTTALPELSKLALLLLVLAFIAIAKYFTDLMNWMFRTLLGPLWPRTGRKQLNPQTTTQALSNMLGAAAQGVDSELGVNFTRMAETAGLVGTFAFEAAAALQRAAVKIARLEDATAGMQKSQGAIRQRQQATESQLGHAQAQAQAQAAQTHAATHSLQQQIDALTHHVSHVIEPELDGLRHAIPDLEKGTATLWDEVSKHSEALGLAGTVAATATALGRLGAGWTRCETNQLVGKELCNTPPDQVRNLLKGLLPLIDIALLCSFVKLISQMGKNPVLLDALGVFSIGVEDLLRCTGATVHPDLPVPVLNLPPVQPWATLAPVSG